MTRTSSAALHAELRNPSSISNQLAALKELKHELIGHEPTKELWVSQGIVSSLARIIRTYAEQGSRAVGALEHDTCLQAIILVGSIAQGGPAFLSSIISGQVVLPLLSMLSPKDSHSKLILAVLRTLNTIADSALLEGRWSDNSETDAIRSLYEDGGLAQLADILDQESPETVVQQQISYAAGLIIKSCTTESRRKATVQSGVLDALAKRLSTFIVAKTPAQFVKGKNLLSQLSPATKTSRLGPILQGIAVIVTGSRSRTNQFISSPSLSAALSAWSEFVNSSLTSEDGALDSLLPPIARESAMLRLGSFPPFNEIATTGKHRLARTTPQRRRDEAMFGLTNILDDEKVPLAYWLAHIAKEELGYTKLMVAWLLALLRRSGFGRKRLERILSMSLIPVLVQMLDGDDTLSQTQPPPYDNSALFQPTQLIVELAPCVLALLVSDNEELQTAAADAGAIKKLSQMLKRSYDPLTSRASASYWSADPTANDRAKEQLGAPGLSPAAYHVLRMRESILSALAAMATFKDDYRKSIINNGVIHYIVDSLNPAPEHDRSNSSESAGNETIVNPISVLLAACEAATALSRSVSTLRTSLIDAGLAKPVFKLLRHPDIQVKIAATGAAVNIVLEFSPMRQDMIEAGVQSILCEHAHSVNAKLRLNSLWALKHLVYSAPNDLKKSCLEELGPGWLKQTICNETGSSYAPGSRGSESMPLTMESSNAAGEQVDLLNSTNDSLHLAQQYEEDDEDEVNMIDSIGALSKPSTRSRQRPKSAGNVEEDAELAEQARRDDVAVQEQALDFIRNLILGEHAKELIDHVFQELGQEKLFDILATLLRPRAVDAFSRDRRSSGSGVKHVPPHTEIVISVCYILVHIAAGLPRHRQLLISHSDLLKLLVPIFNHSASEARTACAWVVINLTWCDDQSDRQHARARAIELRKLGIEQKLEELKDDPVLDTRERIKQARCGMDELLRVV